MEEIKVVQKAGEIDFNLDEIKTQVLAKAKEYDGAVYSEDSVKYAKKDIADLRKYKVDLDTARKQVKKSWMKPYDEFESSIKELIAIIDQPILLIDTQLKEYEEKRIAEKKAAIESAYEELIGEARDYLPLSNIYDTRWENATFSMSSVRDAIKTFSENTINDVDIIKSSISDAVGEALEIYKKTFDLKSALTHINSYEAQKAEILRREQERKESEERERKEREERIERERIQREKEEAERIEREAARKKIEEEERQKAEAQRRIDEVFMATEEQQAEPIPFTPEAEPFVQVPVPMKSSRNIKLVVTEEEFNLFRALMEEHNIEWGEN